MWAGTRHRLTLKTAPASSRTSRTSSGGRGDASRPQPVRSRAGASRPRPSPAIARPTHAAIVPACQRSPRAGGTFLPPPRPQTPPLRRARSSPPNRKPQIMGAKLCRPLPPLPWRTSGAIRPAEAVRVQIAQDRLGNRRHPEFADEALLDLPGGRGAPLPRPIEQVNAGPVGQRPLLPPATEAWHAVRNKSAPSCGTGPTEARR